jgi:hypothetical protein
VQCARRDRIRKVGIPAACICTDGFVSTAKVMTQLCGIPDYPFVVVRHPIGSLTEEELWQQAEAAAVQARGILLGSQ